ncbi:MAG: sigma-70 family RNA polymerase sigma factor [Deltaproteobacteria bacterium]|nr:MAG: sigma-70 family RNA polymerase sigma factor [Deltaproteobacteria bacterium]
MHPTDHHRLQQQTARDLYDDVRRFFRTKLPAPDCYDQAHAVIEAFLKVPPGRIHGDRRAYLMGMARKYVLKYFERQRPTERFDSARMSVSGITSMSERFDRRNVLLNALRSLPLDQQIAVEQHLLERRTYEEVAQTLGVSLATAKRRVADGRRALAEQLADWRAERREDRPAQGSSASADDLDDATVQRLRAAYAEA